MGYKSVSQLDTAPDSGPRTRGQWRVHPDSDTRPRPLRFRRRRGIGDHVRRRRDRTRLHDRGRPPDTRGVTRGCPIQSPQDYRATNRLAGGLEDVTKLLVLIVGKRSEDRFRCGDSESTPRRQSNQPQPDTGADCDTYRLRLRVRCRPDRSRRCPGVPRRRKRDRHRGC